MTNKNDVRKKSIIINSVLIVLLIIIILNFSIHVVRTRNFNAQIRNYSYGQEATEIDVFGRMSGVWEKGDALVPNVTNGGTYEYTITDIADCDIANWTLRIDITQECYLNQAWNGTVEVHQNVRSQNEKIDVVDLHSFEIDYSKLNIESEGEGKNDFMIYLYKGDYLIYHPLSNNATHEYPLGGANESATIGLIFYYDTEFSDPNFAITYQFGRSIWQGTEPIIFMVLTAIWSLIFIVAMVWTIVRRKAVADLAEREAMLEETMGLITRFVDAKDEYTRGHSNRVAEYTVMLAKKIGMHDDDVRHAFYAAFLHDVGKCYVPDEILKKTGKLESEEYALIKKHTTIGGEMLKSIKTIPNIVQGAKYHHERYDGKGYPEGLSGENIPLIGRIISVADAFDAMSSSRCYRPALSKDYVISEIKNNLGTQFDPIIGQAMLDLIAEGKVKNVLWDGDFNQ